MLRIFFLSKNNFRIFALVIELTLHLAVAVVIVAAAAAEDVADGVAVVKDADLAVKDVVVPLILS